MYQPETYGAALGLMLVSMLAWGSWANTMKLTPRWPFQAFYWDYVMGIVLVCLAWGAVLGGPGYGAGVLHAAPVRAVLAFAGGVVFNLANQLLVGAIELAGLSVAFPVGIGLALVLGAGLNYLITPAGNPWLLGVGVLVVLAAIVVDALAYARREEARTQTSGKGLRLSILAGVLMGSFYPFVAASLRGVGALNAYTVLPFFALGIAVCAVPVNTWLMRRPFVGERVREVAYTGAPVGWHLLGVAGGAVWAVGAATNFVASQAHLVGPAASYAIGQGATMVSAAWGVLLWKEFQGAPRSSRRLIPVMFALFLVGLGLIALAPVVRLDVAR